MHNYNYKLGVTRAMVQSRVLLVDDDPAIRFSVGDFLQTRGYVVEEAASLEEARVKLVQIRPDAMLLDHQLPDGGAVDAIGDLLELDPAVVILVLTAHGSIDLAVKAVKQGAQQFLTKPIELDALEEVLRRCLEDRRVRRKQAAEDRSSRRDIDPFLGRSDAIRRLRDDAMSALATQSPILIQGETGTGKGVLAGWLHTHGQRQDQPFVDVNCAGLSRELLDSELFGHARGAFTGAVAEKEGLLEHAHLGVLFLDEIGDMPMPIQGKVLKVLEEQRFRRLGEVRERRVDLQLIAASLRDLAQLAGEGEFRADLYYRISTIPLRVPPLRERQADLEILVGDLMKRLNREIKRSCTRVSPAAMDRIRRHSWPGNIRELRNVLERAMLRCEEDPLEVDDLHFDPVSAVREERVAGGDASGTLGEMEERQIRQALEDLRGNVANAAERLGIPRSTMYVKLKDFDIDPGEYR